MKTIKKPLMVKCKECDWMHSASDETCPMCGSSNTDRAALARRKRKNKERQLKHTIARLYKERDAYKSISIEEVNKCIGFIKLYSEAKRECNELKESLKKEKSRGDALLEEFVKANQRIIFLEMKLSIDIIHGNKQ